MKSKASVSLLSSKPIIKYGEMNINKWQNKTCNGNTMKNEKLQFNLQHNQAPKSNSFSQAAINKSWSEDKIYHLYKEG